VRQFFKAGKNYDGYFTADDVLKQVNWAIDIFKSKTKGQCTGLFMFDNAPSHQKQALDALSAVDMPKNSNPGWTRKKCGVKMQNGWFVNRQNQCIDQPLYFLDNHLVHPGAFKGSKQILIEQGLWPARGDLQAVCKGFKCKPGATSCCCQRLVFNQPDFVLQRLVLSKLVEQCGHICNYYPKYHCKLNFIEQYWGAAKYRYWNTPATHSMDEMRQNICQALDSVPVDSIQR
jgi:hypothetical protein